MRVAALVATTLVLVACGGGDTPDPGPTTSAGPSVATSPEALGTQAAIPDFAIAPEDSEACRLVTAEMASQALGAPVGPATAHEFEPGRGSCQYSTDASAGSLQAAVVSTYPAAEFDTTREVCGEGEEIAGIGRAAYFSPDRCGLLVHLDDDTFIQVQVLLDFMTAGGDRDTSIALAQQVVANAG